MLNTHVIRFQRIILLIALLFTGSILRAQALKPPFEKGVNLSGWFQESSVTQIHFARYTEEDIENIRDMGFDHIRLPINLHAMTGPGPEYRVEDLLFTFLDDVADWCEEAGLHLILDNHTFDPAVDTELGVGEVLLKVWPQMALHFRDRGPLIHYEILNEPHGISDEDWNRIQGEVIDAIRSVDSVHSIVVGPAGWSSPHNLDHMPVYADTNLIYTWHYYDPFLFTHQGASWTSPSMVSLAGIPYPYSSSEMPALPEDLRGSWVESAFSEYSQSAQITSMLQTLTLASDFSRERSVPVWCGEFGVYRINADPQDRARWYADMNTLFKMRDLAWTMWDYRGGFGIFHDNSDERFPWDVNRDIIDALELLQPDSLPEPEGYVPDEGFYFYREYIEAGLEGASFASEGTLNYYSDEAFNGNFCLEMRDVPQYSRIAFRFRSAADLSLLLEKDYFLEFYIRGSGDMALDLRFVDTKESSADHPWRMGITLDRNTVTWDGEWQRIRIPLSDLKEKGSWDNAWYEPQGLFDWQNVEQLDLVAEHSDLSGLQVLLDDICLRDETVLGTEIPVLAHDFRLKVYPNPFNGSVNIAFDPVSNSASDLLILDAAGRNVLTRSVGLNGGAVGGRTLYHLRPESLAMSSGVYFVQLRTAGAVAMEKMLYLK